MEKKEFYSLPELAKLMGISRVAVFKRVKSGAIKAKKIGKAYAVAAEEALNVVGEAEPAKYGEIAIFKENDGGAEIEVKLHNKNVWLSLNQLSALFGRDKSVISRHIDNIFEEGELERGATVAKFATVREEGTKTVKRDIEHYNLDVIISTGYRVKSRAGVRFRIWATGVLRHYLEKGYVLNLKALQAKTAAFKELQSAVKMAVVAARQENGAGMEAELLQVIGNFAGSLETLQEYDDMELKAGGRTKPVYELTYDDAAAVVEKAAGEHRKKTAKGGLFGGGNPAKLKGIIGAINQSFGGHDLYKTVEDKAAHLLYFMVKDHPFTDGNKRLAAVMFLWYMSRNRSLYNGDGSKRISDGALAALTLLIAVSKPEEKDVMVKVAMNVMGERS